jgi:hypothetical protein
MTMAPEKFDEFVKQELVQTDNFARELRIEKQ